MPRLFCIFCCLLAALWGALPAQAQDPQLSQFYASPLVQNPAFAGSAYRPRAFLQYRNQWPALGTGINSAYASGDIYLRKATSGLGIVMARHTAMSGVYQATEARGQYAYHLKLTRKYSLNAGAQLGIQQRSLGYSRITFVDQVDTGQAILPTTDPLATSTRYILPELGMGLLLFSGSDYISISAQHVTSPKLSSEYTNGRLPMWLAITGGHVIRFGPDPRGLRPDRPKNELNLAFIYKRQGPFQQLDLGAYYNLQPIVVGLWYRGLPILPVARSILNQESIIALVGLRQDNLAIGYSYDFNLSSIVPTLAGSHELSLSFTFDPPGPKRRRSRALPCPSF